MTKRKKAGLPIFPTGGLSTWFSLCALIKPMLCTSRSTEHGLDWLGVCCRDVDVHVPRRRVASL
jgi:hypothetical protein